MIRKCTDEDISDKELEKIIVPFYDNYHEYIITYVMPEVIAFYIASSYSRNAIWETTFYQHYNSAKDIFNISDDEDYDRVPAKSGKCWYFRTRYKKLDGTRAQYHSKRYMTKREAQKAEAEFLIKSQNEASISSLIFSQIINLFIENRSTIVKEKTTYGYKNKRPYLDTIANVKLKDFNIEVYERWRRYINSCDISTRYKNDIYKFLKSLLNYATDWYGFSFIHVYRKMHNFNNTNELLKEMLYFTYDEFQKFLSVEKDIKFRCAWQLLYYCGLKIGELKGITWKDIDFENKTVSINK